ncbi:hypothetical protein THIOKS11930004 [Thiocapsa sp. KS1]|nr:hypothetical protein THIOKS11930004 [Thiocapsa sp. KS1]
MQTCAPANRQMPFEDSHIVWSEGHGLSARTGPVKANPQHDGPVLADRVLRWKRSRHRGSLRVIKNRRRSCGADETGMADEYGEETDHRGPEQDRCHDNSAQRLVPT